MRPTETHRSKQYALMFLLGALLTGGALGFTADRMLLRDQICGRVSDPKASRERLAAALDLSDGQRAELDMMLDERRRNIDSVLRPVRPQMDSVIAASRGRMRAMMSPEQAARYDALRREQDAEEKRGGRR